MIDFPVRAIRVDEEKIYTLDQIISTIKYYLSKFSYYPINKIILFGSYAKGEADGISDIDLYVSNSPYFKSPLSIHFFKDLSFIFKKNIDLFLDYNVDKNSYLFHAIERDGIIIYERNKSNQTI